MKRADHRLARLLLVACTALGLAALHTIGHAALDGTAPPSPASAAAAVAPGFVAGGDTSGDGCDGDGCTHHIAPLDRDRHSGAWWEVCLAILSALVVASAAGMTPRATSPRPPVTAGGQRRPPPGARRRPPAGLIVATTAVLRT